MRTPPDTPPTPPGISLGQTFRALRHRNFRIFFLGQSMSLVGTWMQQTAMGWLVYELTGSEFLLGVVAAVGTAPMLFLSIYGGALADRFSKRNILIVTQVVSMIVAFGLAALVWDGRIDTWQIIVASTIGGVAMAFDMPARQSFFIELTSRDDLLNAISLNSSAFNAARLVGPAVAGFVLERASAASCFFFNGLSFIAVIIGLVMLRLPKAEPRVPTSGDMRHALGGLVYVREHPRVRTIMTLFAVVGVFGWSYAVLMPAFAQDVLHLSAKGYGALMSATGFGAFLGAMTVATVGDRFPPRRVALAGLWIFSVAMCLFAISRMFVPSLLLLALSGAGSMLFFATANSTVQSIVPDEMRGRVMGVWSLIFGAMVPLGSIQAGLLAKWIGSPWAIAIGGIVSAAAGIVTVIMIRRREARRDRAS